MDAFKIKINSLIKPDDSSLKNIAQRNFFRVSPNPSASTQHSIENEHQNNNHQQQQQQQQQQYQFRQSSQYYFQNNQQSYQLQPQKSLQSVGNFTMNKLISINELGEIILNPVSEWNDQVVFNTKDHSNLNMHLLGSQSFNPNANFSLVQSKLFKGESFRINMNPSEQSNNGQNNNSKDNNATHSDDASMKINSTQDILKCSADENSAVGMQQSIELDHEQTQSYLKSMVPYQNSTNSSLKVSYPQSVQQQGKSLASDQANQGDSAQQESLYYQSKQSDQRNNENNTNNVEFRDNNNTWSVENNLKQQQKILNPNEPSNGLKQEEQIQQQFQQQGFQEQQLNQNNTGQSPSAVRIDQNNIQQQGQQIQQQVVQQQQQQQYQYQQPYQNSNNNNNNFQQLTFANSPLYFLNNNLSDCQSKVCEVMPSGLSTLPNNYTTNPTYVQQQQQQQQQPQYSIPGIIAPLNNNSYFSNSSFSQQNKNLNQQHIYENNNILNNSNNSNITNYRTPVIAPAEPNVGLYFPENSIQNNMNITQNNTNNNNNTNSFYYPYQYQYQYYTPAFPANTALITPANNPYMQISSSNNGTIDQQQQSQYPQQKYSLNLSKILDVSSNSSNTNNNGNNLIQKSSFFLENSNKICLIDTQLKAQCDEVRSELYDDDQNNNNNNPENSQPCDMEEYHPQSHQELQNTTIFQPNTPMESYQPPSASDESKSHNKREVKLISKTKKISRQKKDLENKYRQSQHKNVFKNFGGTLVRFTLYNPHFQDRLATEFFPNDADKRDFEEWLQQDARLTNKSEFLKAWITFKEDQPEIKIYKSVLKELSRDFFENFALIYLMNTSKISNFEVHLRSIYTYLAALNSPETLDRFKPTPLQPLE